MTRVAILDYGMGNLRSVEKALERVGASVEITHDAERVHAADGVILPGVGAFPAAMRRVRELGLDELVRASVAAGTPVLGICLGLQLLFSRSTEHDGEEGIGLLPGTVERLAAEGLKLPHIGWEPVHWARPSPLTDGIDEGTPFYLVHSFAPRPERADDVLGTAAYGDPFVCAVERPPLYGVQFHPEKSSAAGLRLLANFAETCAARASDEVAHPTSSDYRSPSGSLAHWPAATPAPKPAGSASEPSARITGRPPGSLAEHSGGAPR